MRNARMRKRTSPASSSLRLTWICLGLYTWAHTSFSIFGPVVQVVDGFAYAPNFITKIVASSLNEDGNEDHDTGATPPAESTSITTRFPPEPNGYLHLGHAKAISFNFAVSKMFGGRCHMRLDDTNPSKEDEEYVESILEDVKWIQSSPQPWTGDVRKTSDYFDLIYRCAESLIESGDAYVEELSAEEMREYRGSLTDAGKESPFRNRPVEENLALFRSMRDGDFPDGRYVLRAKIDMASPNMNMRDPTLYRIKHESHQATKDKWCIYPMYDFSHPISDAVEGITHSLCTLEFEDHRPLYDWTIDRLRANGIEDIDVGGDVAAPRQIEFSRLNIKSTVLSKRKLIQLVTQNIVSGWDDPRLPTLSGIRRRGIPSEAIRLFCERVGISKSDSNIDYGDLENCAREVMDENSPRAFAVLKPLKVTLTNWGSGKSLEDFEIPRHPKLSSLSTRTVPFGKHLYIERDDFFDTEGPEGQNASPPKGFKRLLPNGKVRLKFAYVVECEDIIRDETTNEPIELLCKVYPDTRAGVTPEGMSRVKGIIHWVEASTAAKITVNSYDRLFQEEEPGKDGRDYLEDLNPNSLEQVKGAVVEPGVAMDALHIMAQLRQQDRAENNDNTQTKIYPSALSYQFERQGYFALDKESDTKQLIFNRVVTLRDTWAASRGPKDNKGNNNNDSNNEGQAVRRRGGGNNENTQNTTPLDDIRRIALRAGTILSAEPHPEADSLLVLSVDCGDEKEDGTPDDPRTVVAGLANTNIPMDSLVQQKVACLTNLKPAKMRGIESRAMLLAAVEDDNVQLLQLPDSIPNGQLLTFENIEPSQPDAMLKSKGAVKVWDRVKALLQTNDEGEAVYMKDGTESCRILTSDGSAIKTSFTNAKIG